jgi:hypothetical protein
MGINTITQLVSLGFKESILIASRDGLAYVDRFGVNLYKINENLVKGIYVSIRINERKLKSEEFYNHIMRYKKFNKIKKNKKYKYVIS